MNEIQKNELNEFLKYSQETLTAHLREKHAIWKSSHLTFEQKQELHRQLAVKRTRMFLESLYDEYETGEEMYIPVMEEIVKMIGLLNSTE